MLAAWRRNEGALGLQVAAAWLPLLHVHAPKWWVFLREREEWHQALCSVECARQSGPPALVDGCCSPLPTSLLLSAGDEAFALLQYGAGHADINGPGLMEVG